ncbi:MAG TPA: hypothetical protein VIV12_05895, partial [Streptosporangiaceae bacterium]
MRAIGFRKIAVASVLVSSLGLGAALAVTTTGGDRVKQWEGVQVAPPDFACTSSITFGSMPGMTLPFELNREGQVVILFQGQFGGGESAPDARAVIRFDIDGAIAGSAVAVGNDLGTGLQTFGYNAFSAPLPAG